VRSKFFDIEKLFDDNENPKNDFCFQLLLYLWLFGKDKDMPAYRSLHSGVWSFRRIQDGIRNITFSPEPGSKIKDPNIGPEQLLAFEEFLSSMLQRLFDEEDDFVQTSDEKNCEYCAYKAICRKG
jgi:hypothetical protein